MSQSQVPNVDENSVTVVPPPLPQEGSDDVKINPVEGEDVPPVEQVEEVVENVPLVEKVEEDEENVPPVEQVEEDEEVDEVKEVEENVPLVDDVEDVKVNIIIHPTITGDVPIPNPNILMYEMAYKRFKDLVKGKGHNLGSILILVANAVQIVQTLKRGKGADFLTGKEKKAIVINMIKRWIDESPNFTEQDKIYLRDIFVPCMLDGAITSLCSLDVNKASQKATKKLITWCCGTGVIEEENEENEENK